MLTSEVLLATILACVSGASAMSPEETTVRSVYSSFVVASRIYELMEPGQRMAGGPLVAVNISKVQVGDLSEVLNEPIEDLVTVPSGETIESTPGTWDLNEHRVSAFVAVGKWAPVKSMYGGVDQQDWRAPLAAVFGGRAAELFRYATYRVTVVSRGRQRQYKAMFLFGYPDGARRKIEIVDYILGISTLTTLLNGSLAHDVAQLPNRVGVGRDSEAEAVRDAARAVQGCVFDPVTQFCCDADTGLCGIDASLLDGRGPN